jgi:virginiamycin B lyase
MALKQGSLSFTAIGVLFWAALLLAGCAQPQSDTHVISGSVQDDRDAPLHGAVVGARNLEVGVSTFVVTNAKGEFQTPPLRKGSYQISIEQQGYHADTLTLDLDDPPQPVHVQMEPLSIVPVSQITNVDFNSHLPEDSGKRTVIRICGQCHSLRNPFLTEGRTRDEWVTLAERMMAGVVWSGPDNFTELDTGPMVDYLAKHHGPDSTLPEQLGEQVKVAGNPGSFPIGHDLIFTEYDIPQPPPGPLDTSAQHGRGRMRRGTSGSHTAAPDQSGNVWFTQVDGKKIGQLQISSGQVKEYPLSPGYAPHGITAGPDGIVWFAGYPSVLGRIDPKTETLEEIPVPDMDNGSPTMPHSVIVAADGKVWLTESDRMGQERGSFSSYDPVTGEFSRYLFEKGDSPYGIIEHGGLIWFALIRPGKIGFLDPQTGEMKTFNTPTPDSGVRRLRFDRKGRLWFGEWGTDKIGMFDPSTQQFTEYDLPFPSSPYGVYTDSKGYVWLATHARDSFIRFDPEKEEIVEYPLPLGSIIRDIWPDQEGRMWFISGWLRDKVGSAEIAGN